MSNFSEWGIAELPLQEVPDFPTTTLQGDAGVPVSGVKSGVSGDATAAAATNAGAGADTGKVVGASGEAPLQEFWLPVIRRSTGEQIGVLLVEAQRMRV